MTASYLKVIMFVMFKANCNLKNSGKRVHQCATAASLNHHCLAYKYCLNSR